MSKTPKTIAELQEIILAELRKHEETRGVRSVSITRYDDDSVDFDWDVTGHNPGTATTSAIRDVLTRIVPALQAKYCCKE